MSNISPQLIEDMTQLTQATEEALAAVQRDEWADIDSLKQRTDDLCKAAVAEASESDDATRQDIIAKLEAILGRLQMLEQHLAEPGNQGQPS